METDVAKGPEPNAGVATGAGMPPTVVGGATAPSKGPGTTATGLTTVDVTLAAPVPSDAKALVVRLVGLTLDPQGGGTPVVVDFSAPVEIDLLAPGPMLSPGALGSLAIPAGRYGTLSLSLDVAAPCVGADSLGAALACRTPPGSAILQFVATPGGAIEIRQGAVSRIALSAAGADPAWAFAGWVKQVTRAEAAVGVKVVLPAIPGEVAVVTE